MDKPRGNPNGSSNHDHVLAAFDEAGYTVAYRMVDAFEAVPATRSRVHYVGVHREALMKPFSTSKLTNLWTSVTQDARFIWPDEPLDSFLWGSFSDPKLQDMPSVKQNSDKQPDVVQLPPFADEIPEPKKHRVANEPAWPDLHKKVMADNGASSLQDRFQLS